MLTNGQRRVIRCYQAFAKEGVSPSLADLATSLELKKVTVYEHVRALVEKGFLDAVPTGNYHHYMLRTHCKCCGARLRRKVIQRTTHPKAVKF